MQGGARLIQIRDKSRVSRVFLDSVVAAVSIARPLGVKIIVNDRIDIALAANADGVHLGQHDLPPDMARRLLGEQAIIGYSTHTLNQAKEARAMPINYIALGPIFPTKSKENPDPIVGTAELAFVRNVIGSIPLVAIGGITAENLLSVFAAGADSAAIIGALVAEPGLISERMAELKRKADAFIQTY